MRTSREEFMNLVKKRGSKTKPKKVEKPKPKKPGILANIFKPKKPAKRKYKKRQKKEEPKVEKKIQSSEGDNEILRAREPIKVKSPLHQIIPKFRGYKIPVVIIRKIGGRLEYVHDVAKRVKMPHGTHKFNLWFENRSIQYPPPEAWIDGKVWIYSPRKNEYTFLILDISAGKIKAINSDMVFWVENEIIEAINKYNNPNKWATIIPYVGIGVFMICAVLALVIFMKQWYMPAMEAVKHGVSVTTNCTCPIQLPPTGGMPPV